jgi:hypothetical protein
MPAGVGQLLSKDRYNWYFDTEGQPHMNNRRLFWPRGKVLGGSSAINAMVYCRGLPGDFDDWRAAGNPGWGWADVAPAYQQLERRVGADGTLQGDGPLWVSEREPEYHPVKRHFLAAARQLGLPATADFNGPQPEGVGAYAITTRRGLRCSAADAFLRPALARPNLTLRTGALAQRILFEGRRAVGVEAGGRLHAVDAVVVNADFAHAIPGLMEEEQRPQWPDKKIAEARYSCSTFMLYLGIEGQLDLAHHTVLLAEDYENNLAQIEAGIIPQNPSLYVQAAASTDPSMAPPGHSTLYMLVPVPNLLGGADWATEEPRYRRLALDRLKAIGLHDIESRIRYEKIISPQGWQDEYAVGYGATFNLAHNVRQMMHFRPRNRFGRAT